MKNERKFSFEMETIPILVSRKEASGIQFGGMFIDIGVPEDYHKAQRTVPDWFRRESIQVAFIDRDNTITEDAGYTYRVEDLVLRKGVLTFLRQLARWNYRIVIVSNQAGIAKGMFTSADADAFNDALCRRLLESGVEVLDVLICPYHEDGTVIPYQRDSYLRKPNPGMILLAAEKHKIDLRRSFMVGDSPSDGIQLPYMKSYILDGGRGFDEILKEIEVDM